MTRSEAITIVHDRLGQLAIDAGLTDDEASYGYALDYALRSLLGSTDISDVTVELTNELLDLFELASLRKLRGYYVLLTNVTVGPRKEEYGSIIKVIDQMIGPGPLVIKQDAVPVFNDFYMGSGLSGYPINYWQIYDWP